MLVFKVSESTAARRRVPLHCVDATDGYTPETGEGGGQPQLSKNGAAFSNTTATLTSIGQGAYYVELTAGELDTVGFFIVRYKSANTREFQIVGQVVSYDAYDATAFGISRLDAAISSRSTLSQAQAQTACESAFDVAIPGSPTADSINERIKTLDTAYTATRGGYLDYLDAAVSTRATPTQVNSEVADVVKTDTVSEQSAGAPPAAPTIEEAIGYLYMAWRNKCTATSSLLQYHNDAGSALCKAALSDDSTTFTRNELTAP